jgi:spore coat protein U-like protein
MKNYTQVRRHSVKLALATAFALGAASIGGAAQAAVANATASATVVAPITISKTTDLAFGNFYASAATGTIKVDTNNTRSVSGGVTLGTGSGTAASFNITGQASATYTIAYATGVTLTGPGTAMALTQVSDTTAAGGASTLATSGTLSAGGAQSLYLGGTLAVGANQVAGAYSGAISATVDYN